MQSAVDQLRKYREENSRAHDEILDLWTNVLSKHNLSPLGDEKWLILEQIFKSALHSSRQSLASDCLQQLTNRFKSTSHRISILRAMLHESTGDYNEADKIYSALLTENETDAPVRKRKIAMLKAQNQIREAIRQLTEFLELYQADQEGWSELCELYLSQHDYIKAGSCAEELLLFNPHNHLLHERYASICYSAGEYKKARSYYFSTIKLNPTNLRALFGILLTSVNNKSESTLDHDRIIRDDILDIYREKLPDLLPIVEKTLQKLLP